MAATSSGSHPACRISSIPQTHSEARKPGPHRMGQSRSDARLTDL
jgi:hypothetical protein